MKSRRPIAERLWERVVKTDTCWLWTGPLTAGGYGVLGEGPRGGSTVRVHRLAYELLVGPIPPATPHIDHVCRVRRCCNPAHLEPVTQAENNRRAGLTRTRCPHGHLLDPRPVGKRRPGCATCTHIRYSQKDAA